MLDQEFKPEEIEIEVTLRPSTLDEFIGQAQVKDNLKVFIEAAMTPVTYLVVAFLKRTENEDYYDKDTNFNPFLS